MWNMAITAKKWETVIIVSLFPKFGRQWGFCAYTFSQLTVRSNVDRLRHMLRIHSILNAIFPVIAGVHNSEVGHHGLQMCKKRLKAKGYNFTDRIITQFIRQCPCCQEMNRLRIPIRMHPFTCASYNPFEVLHLHHIGPLKADDKGYTYILVIIDAFSWWVKLFLTTSVCAYETTSCLFQHFGPFSTPAAIHTDRGTAFHN